MHLLWGPEMTQPQASEHVPGAGTNQPRNDAAPRILSKITPPKETP